MIETINDAIKELGRLDELLLVPIALLAVAFALCLASVFLTILIRGTWILCHFIATSW